MFESHHQLQKSPETSMVSGLFDFALLFVC
nr:MAG TPA_asm: hypothetical protein [Caudoviricetes sp.]